MWNLPWQSHSTLPGATKLLEGLDFFFFPDEEDEEEEILELFMCTFADSEFVFFPLFLYVHHVRYIFSYIPSIKHTQLEHHPYLFGILVHQQEPIRF